MMIVLPFLVRKNHLNLSSNLSLKVVHDLYLGAEKISEFNLSLITIDS